MSYTPINEYKISKAAKEFLKEARRMNGFCVKRIHVPRDVFQDILNGVSISEKELYRKEIPFEGKILVSL